MRGNIIEELHCLVAESILFGRSHIKALVIVAHDEVYRNQYHQYENSEHYSDSSRKVEFFLFFFGLPPVPASFLDGNEGPCEENDNGRRKEYQVGKADEAL